MLTDTLAARMDSIIDETAFSGVVHISRHGALLYARARGLSDRAHGVPNTMDTQFAIASGTKAFTALAVLSLVADGVLELESLVQKRLGGAAELVGPDVTVRHLLAHTSGIGDYLDESTIADIDDYILDVPVHRLGSPRDFLPILRGRAPKFTTGTSFDYCNSGYVILALLIEAVTGRSYYDVLEERVFAKAGMQSTSFPRLDALPGAAAIGYLPKRDWRSNHLHLPVRGGGDGGAYTTTADIDRFWAAIFDGRIVPQEMVETMTRCQHPVSTPSRGYGLGFWLPSDPEGIVFEGSDPGIAFRSTLDSATKTVYTVVSNVTAGAWPLVRALETFRRDAAGIRDTPRPM